MREGLRCPTLLGTLARTGCWGRECCFFSGTLWKVAIAAAADSKPSVHTHAITVKLSTAHLKQDMGMKRVFFWKEWFLQKTEEDEEGKQRVKTTGIHYVHL